MKWCPHEDLHLEPQRLEGAHAKALTPCGLFETHHRTSSYRNGRASRLRSAYLADPNGADFYLPHAREKVVERPGIAPGVSCLPDRRIHFLPRTRKNLKRKCFEQKRTKATKKQQHARSDARSDRKSNQLRGFQDTRSPFVFFVTFC